MYGTGTYLRIVIHHLYDEILLAITKTSDEILWLILNRKRDSLSTIPHYQLWLILNRKRDSLSTIPHYQIPKRSHLRSWLNYEWSLLLVLDPVDTPNDNTLHSSTRPDEWGCYFVVSGTTDTWAPWSQGHTPSRGCVDPWLHNPIAMVRLYYDINIDNGVRRSVNRLFYLLYSLAWIIPNDCLPLYENETSTRAVPVPWVQPPTLILSRTSWTHVLLHSSCLRAPQVYYYIFVVNNKQTCMWFFLDCHSDDFYSNCVNSVSFKMDVCLRVWSFSPGWVNHSRWVCVHVCRCHSKWVCGDWRVWVLWFVDVSGWKTCMWWLNKSLNVVVTNSSNSKFSITNSINLLNNESKTNFFTVIRGLQQSHMQQHLKKNLKTMTVVS